MRRPSCGLLSLIVAVAVAGEARSTIASDEPTPTAVRDLKPLVFEQLPLGAIKPAGWLAGQLRIQANGLSGHLDEFWPDIKESAWIGGKAEGWERTPYWLDGIVPLAFLLDDPALKAKAKRFIDYIVDHQQPDGWLGPIGDNDPKHKPYDVWPLFPLLKALTQYQQATGDPRIIPLLRKCCRKIDEVCTKQPLYSWAHFRAADLVVSLYWLYDQTGDKSLLDLSEKVLQQGYDWRRHFEHFEPYRAKTTKFGLDNHGVNNGMALKFGGIRSRLTGNAGDRNAIFTMLDQLDRYHGQANGIFTCDEHYAGRSPSQGTELCTVVEAMYSLELLAGITGDSRLGDRLEKLAFNALPATFKKDMCAHQYDQQCNQVICKLAEERVYTNNGPDANLYGLEPNFGCCTANLHQGWPKFVEHLWMKSADGGLVAISYAPCAVATRLNGKPVRVEVETAYPFGDKVTFQVGVEGSMSFPMRIRVPAWVGGLTVEIKDERSTRFESLAIQQGVSRFATINTTWNGNTTVNVRMTNPIRLGEGYDGAVFVERGPLVYALKMGSEWRKLKGTEPFADWEVLPTSAWNYALRLDRDHLEKSLTFEAMAPGDSPFSTAGAPIAAKVMGRRLPSWTLSKNAAAPPPRSPVESSEPLEELILIPYGCTDLRVTEFPILK